MSGRLDCGSDTFSAEIADGSHASFWDVPLALPLSGSFMGQRDLATQQLAGNWWYGQTEGPICNGKWDASPQ